MKIDKYRQMLDKLEELQDIAESTFMMGERDFELIKENIENINNIISKRFLTEEKRMIKEYFHDTP